MEFGTAVTLALLALWVTVLLCAAAGAVLYHWPVDVNGDARRGFDVLPPPPAR